MNLIDMRIVIISYVISNAICTAFITLLWLQNRRRFEGIGFWPVAFTLHLGAMTLIALRGIAPDILSMVAGNALLIVGTTLLYVGLERFVGKRGPQVHNAILMVIFVTAHGYFSIFRPSMAARNITISLGLLVLCAQSAWLMLKRVDIDMRPITRNIGVILIVVCVISMTRIIINLVAPPAGDFFLPDSLDTVLLFAYQLPFIALAVSLPLMVNHRLIADLEDDIAERGQVEHALSISEEKFFKAFESSPDAILISCLSDGRITEVNEGFCRIMGYSQEETLGQTAISLNMWANLQDREQCIADLQKNRSIRGREYDFRAKSGKILNGLYSGAIIYLGNEAYILSIVRDITRRKQAEDALRRSEEHLKMSQGIAHLGSWELDLINNRLMWSDEVYHIFGLEPREFDATYEAFLDAVHPDDRTAVADAYTGSIREGRDTYEIEHRIVRKTNGEIRYVHEKSRHLRDRSGNAIRSIGMVHDITERKQAEEALRRSEAKLRGLIEQSPDGITLTNEQGLITEWNRAMEQITGLKAAEAIGRPVWDAQFQIGIEERKTPEIYQQVKTMIVNILKSGEISWLGQLVDTDYQHSDGTRRFMQSVTFPIKTDHGLMLSSVIRDVTEHKRAEAIAGLRLKLWEYAATHPVDELMQKALDEIENLTNSSIGFYHFIEEDQNTLSLQAWSTRTQEKFCKAEGKGMHYAIDAAGVWVDCIHQRQPVIHNHYASLPHRKGMPDGHAEVVRELVVPTMRDGQIVSILGVGNKPTDYTKKDIELVAYVADVVWEIVERRRAEEALRRSNAELQARNEELDAFGHTVAHDLRGPLSNIISFAYVLEDQENPLPEEEAFSMIQTIKQMGLKMNNIIEELMLLAGLRRSEVTMEPLNMNSIIRDTIKRLSYLIEGSQVRIVYPSDCPIAIGHAPWVEEVWVNYISNAIKYGGTPPHIEIETVQEGDTVQFRIRDNGIGLTAEEQARLFTPFERLGKTHLAGHGLGLSIVRRIVERMDGQVGVESTGIPGEGSTFSFMLPSVQDQPKPEKESVHQGT
ncbi:MAG: PAS domain S-box protein [Anaerolineae bacterium]|nr:PAS domain S-box protein [Anaerolineae bacterium]